MGISHQSLPRGWGVTSKAIKFKTFRVAPELLITVPKDSFHVKAEGLLSKSNYLDKFTGNCNWSVFGTCFGTFYYLSLLSSLLPSLYFTLYTEVCLFIGSNYFFFCIYLCLNFCICRCSLNIVQWRWSVFGRAQLWPLPCHKCIVHDCAAGWSAASCQRSIFPSICIASIHSTIISHHPH